MNSLGNLQFIARTCLCTNTDRSYRYSTGGIIALGLGVEGWSVDDCIRHFEKLCETAFTPRELHNIPVLGKLAMMNHSYSKYKTKPLEKVLKDTFSVSEQPLFGGQHTHSHSSVRTAVTSTKETGEKAVLLANYNRSHEKDDQCMYPVGILASSLKTNNSGLLV